MNYQLKKTNYNNFKVIKDNTFAKRSYFIPFTSLEKLKNTDFRQERYNSDIISCLSGEWDFKFYKDCRTIPQEINTSKIKFDKVNVPSVWQRTGYLNPVYLNCPYEQKTMYPDVPEDMPAGIYRKEFVISDVSKMYLLTFLGVASNMELYVNGKYVGYSEGSHNTAEFDISKCIVHGANELVLLSYKWCCGTFLECQDMFRENGIFRDVLLSEYDNTYILDYHFVSDKVKDGYKSECKVLISGETEGYTIKTEIAEFSNCNEIICDNVIAKSENDASDTVNIDYGVLTVNQWNAEAPFTYALYITLLKDGKEIMSARQFIGFKTVEVSNCKFRFNDKLIKFKGVNHHDSHPVKGYCMSEEDYEKDIVLMKEFNVNAVRTSHYPPDPIMLMLCDFYGLYVIDEADIETHGLFELCDNFNAISDDLKWKKHYLDRVSSMYERDKNHPSVTMWSLGNEAGGIKNQIKCYEYLKSTGTKIPVHYEGANPFPMCGFDVISHMYTSIYDVGRIGGETYAKARSVKKAFSSKPFFLCEYAHAMGQGPGSLEDYWKLFYKYDNLMGGCIWEWVDHSVYHGPEDKKYKYEYTYGGDHKEKQHDGNFCVDGLFYPDRTPHSGAYEMKNVYRPLRISFSGEKEFKITNTNRFRYSDYIKIMWTRFENGIAVENGDFVTAVEPCKTELITVPFKDFDKNKDCIITFRYVDILSGKEIAFEQAVINDVAYIYKTEKTKGNFSVDYKNGEFTVKFDKGYVKFNEASGQMTDYCVNGYEFLNNAPVTGNYGFIPNVFRAALDNDRNIKQKWFKLGLNNIKIQNNTTKLLLENDTVTVSTNLSLMGKNKLLFNAHINYFINTNGSIDIASKLISNIDMDKIDIPRFGLMVELNKELDTVEYYGRGLHENLPDFNAQSPIGIFEEKVDDMHEPYIYPQDNSNHGDVKHLVVKSNNHMLEIFPTYVEDYEMEYDVSRLSFSCHNYTQDNLSTALHREDIEKVDSTILSVDGFVRGSGSNSCGPNPLDEFIIKDSELSFAITIKGE